MKLSVMVASRKDSWFLPQFLEGFFSHTARLDETELLVMHSALDTKNADLIQSYRDRATFVPENYRLGRAGHHIYFNELARMATGEWVIGLCEDMAFLTHGWDDLFRMSAASRSSSQVWAFSPQFTPYNAPMAHLVSRGYLDVMGSFAECANVDSWVNALFFNAAPNRILGVRDILFYDYTHDGMYADRYERVAFPDLDYPRIAQECPIWGSPMAGERLVAAIGRLKQAVVCGH